MARRLPQLIILVSGAVLIGIGIVAISAQMISEFMHNSPVGRNMSAIEMFPGRASVSTSYVGIELVVIGAVLEMVGFIGSGPWKDRPNSK